MSTEPPGAWVYTEQERVRADTAEEDCLSLEGALAMMLELNKRYGEALERIAKGALGPQWVARKALGQRCTSVTSS